LETEVTEERPMRRWTDETEDEVSEQGTWKAWLRVRGLQVKLLLKNV